MDVICHFVSVVESVSYAKTQCLISDFKHGVGIRVSEKQNREVRNLNVGFPQERDATNVVHYHVKNLQWHHSPIDIGRWCYPIMV